MTENDILSIPDYSNDRWYCQFVNLGQGGAGKIHTC